MSYHTDDDAIQAALVRSSCMLISMVNDMRMLHNKQRSVSSILRYMLCSYNYKIDKIVIGDRPYPDHMIPYLGAAYSQNEDSLDTPSVKVIAAHLPEYTDSASCIRESWRLLHKGYLFINSSYAIQSTNDVQVMERVERTIEFICSLCGFMSDKYTGLTFTFMSMGTMAKYCVTKIATRLRASGIDNTCMHTVQPAAYAKYLSMPDKLGLHEDYMCFTKTGIKFMQCMIQGYRSVRYLAIEDINMTTNPGITEILSGTVRGMMTEAESIAGEIRTMKNEVTSKSMKIDMIISVLERMQQSNIQLLTVLHSNAFITAVVMDAAVPAASVATAATKNTAPPATSTTSAQATSFSGTTVSAAQNMDDTSQVTDPSDFLSPMKKAGDGTPRKPPSTPNTGKSDKPRTISSPVPSIAISATPPKAKGSSVASTSSSKKQNTNTKTSIDDILGSLDLS